MKGALQIVGGVSNTGTAAPNTVDQVAPAAVPSPMIPAPASTPTPAQSPAPNPTPNPTDMSAPDWWDSASGISTFTNGNMVIGGSIVLLGGLLAIAAFK